MKEIMLLPCLLALGVGLSLNNARAVLEAVFNHQSDFHPHPEIWDRTQASAAGAIAAICLSKSVLPAAEMFFAVYFQLLCLVRD